MFWMVLGSGVPVFRHNSLQAARKEAERLAKQHVGQSFTVLESVATVRAEGVSWEDLRVDVPKELPTTCMAGRDGDCFHEKCPQLVDRKSHCPLDNDKGGCLNRHYLADHSDRPF